MYPKPDIQWYSPLSALCGSRELSKCKANRFCTQQNTVWCSLKRFPHQTSGIGADILLSSCICLSEITKKLR